MPNYHVELFDGKTMTVYAGNIWDAEDEVYHITGEHPIELREV